jgi:uncharacterized membrane protein
MSADRVALERSNAMVMGPATTETIHPPSKELRTNVGAAERWISALLGGALAVHGIRQRSLGGLLLSALGGVLIDRGVRGHCAIYESLNLDTARYEPARPEDYFRRGIHVRETVTIHKSPQELYRFWRDFTNLPRIMRHLESVRVLDEKRSHWKAMGPAGYTVEWDAEVINDEPDQTIAWRSLANAMVASAGSVRFVPTPGDQGTRVQVTLDYIPPAGRLGAMIAKLFGEEPAQQLKDDLRQFKAVMETGEAPTIEGQARGSARGYSNSA